MIDEKKKRKYRGSRSLEMRKMIKKATVNDKATEDVEMGKNQRLTIFIFDYFALKTLFKANTCFLYETQLWVEMG